MMSNFCAKADDIFSKLCDLRRKLPHLTPC